VTGEEPLVLSLAGDGTIPVEPVPGAATAYALWWAWHATHAGTLAPTDRLD
jgi:hypothetical protein